MDDHKQMTELLEKLNASTRKQVRWARVQCLFTLIVAICFAGVFLQIREVLPQLQLLLTELPGMLGQLQQVLTNMVQVTEELAAVDFASTVDGINQMVNMGQTSLQGTVEKLNSIDFEALNLAIENLSRIVNPLADFLNRFR